MCDGASSSENVGPRARPQMPHVGPAQRPRAALGGRPYRLLGVIRISRTATATQNAMLEV